MIISTKKSHTCCNIFSLDMDTVKKETITPSSYINIHRVSSFLHQSLLKYSCDVKMEWGDKENGINRCDSITQSEYLIQWRILNSPSARYYLNNILFTGLLIAKIKRTRKSDRPKLPSYSNGESRIEEIISEVNKFCLGMLYRIVLTNTPVFYHSCTRQTRTDL